jgi:hypothetical protein
MTVLVTKLVTGLVTKLVTKLVDTNTEVEGLEGREAVDPDPAEFPRTTTLEIPRIITVPTTTTLATVEKAIRDRGWKRLRRRKRSNCNLFRSTLFKLCSVYDLCTQLF